MSNHAEAGKAAAESARGTRIYRHSVVVRVTHWINLLCMTVLLMSGLQIFNAHPALYWGNASRFGDPVLAIRGGQLADGRYVGVTTILGHSFDTTGVLGFSMDGGEPQLRAFPKWATLPSGQWLAMGRRWHFFFAWLFVINGVVYVVTSLLNRHFARDLLPTRRDWRQIGRSIWDHLRLRFPRGEEARRYNVLQKLSYVIVAFLLGPIIVLAGLTMSPSLDAGYPWLLTLFGGRQSARTIHFLCAAAFLAFVLIHLVMVLLTGVWNNLRSMISGWYDIGETRDESAKR